MSANQPTSFRYPFALPEDIHPQIKNALRLTYQGVKDLNDAIVALTPKVNANTASVKTVIQSVAIAGSSPPASFPVFGKVNLQPNLTPGAYTTVQSDLAGLVVVNSAIPFAYTLNSGLMTPFFVTAFNIGTANVTATPSTGLVNNVASLVVLPNQFGIFYFDGTNWWGLIPPTTIGLTVYFSNAAAIAGGLTAGQLYRSGSDPDVVCVVH